MVRLKVYVALPIVAKPSSQDNHCVEHDQRVWLTSSFAQRNRIQLVARDTSTKPTKSVVGTARPTACDHETRDTIVPSLLKSEEKASKLLAGRELRCRAGLGVGGPQGLR